MFCLLAQFQRVGGCIKNYMPFSTARWITPLGHSKQTGKQVKNVKSLRHYLYAGGGLQFRVHHI